MDAGNQQGAIRFAERVLELLEDSSGPGSESRPYQEPLTAG